MTDPLFATTPRHAGAKGSPRHSHQQNWPRLLLWVAVLAVWLVVAVKSGQVLSYKVTRRLLLGDGPPTRKPAAATAAAARHGQNGATVAVRATVAAAAADSPALPPGPPHCSRMLWLTGLQVEGANGSTAQYIESGDSYLYYYASALRSAREHAPSLLPVLVTVGTLPQDFLEWAAAQGALVVPHNLTFASRLLAAASPEQRPLQESLLASYARLDMAAVMQLIEQRLRLSPGGGGAGRGLHLSADAGSSLQRGQQEGQREGQRWWLDPPADLDTGYALWTDPDVLFRQDMDGCSLPRPPLLSISAEVAHGTALNCGVMYVNVSAMGRMLPDILEFADEKKWIYPHDQELLLNYIRERDVRLTGLPDAFNYKAYWGEPEGGFMGVGNHQVPNVAIVHTHGPKPGMALCVVSKLSKVVEPETKAQWGVASVMQHREWLVHDCELGSPPYLDILLEIMAAAFKADNGTMYRWVLTEQRRLCPGKCWQAGAATTHPALHPTVTAAAKAAAAEAAGAKVEKGKTGKSQKLKRGKATQGLL